MGLGLAFVTGLITSLHCIAMCGNFILTFAVTGEQKAVSRLSAALPHIYYSAAKLVSYGSIGLLAGFLGSFLNLGRFKGVVSIVGGLFMVLMALNMLNVHPSLRVFSMKMPAFMSRRVFKSANSANQFAPMFFGLMNGLMPCGPLQAMIIYAAGSGSPVAGAGTMLAFGLGTVPLMMSYGTFASFLAKKFKHQVTLVSALIIIILGLVVLNRGLVLSGFKYNFKYAQDTAITLLVGEPKGSSAKVNDQGVQEVKIDIQGGYVPNILTVEPGKKVRLTVNRPTGDACSDSIVFPQYGVDTKLKPFGTTVIEFTPDAAGVFPFTCGMGMYQGTLRVIPAGQGASGKPDLARNRLVAGGVLLAILITLSIKPPDKARLKEIVRTGNVRARPVPTDE